MFFVNDLLSESAICDQIGITEVPLNLTAQPKQSIVVQNPVVYHCPCSVNAKGLGLFVTSKMRNILS
jgi:hypothetical protein